MYLQIVVLKSMWKNTQIHLICFSAPVNPFHRPCHDTEILSQTLDYMILGICGSQQLWPHQQAVDLDGYRSTTLLTLVLAVGSKILLNTCNYKIVTNLYDFSWGDI